MAANALIIVESPAKARTIAKFLGSGYAVESSIGHIRDLPSKTAEIPTAHRKKPWARTGVDVENGFKPLYVVPASKKAQVKKLKELLADADALFLATDEDREGEAIAWHLTEVLKPKVPIKRMVFHEITKKAITQALSNPRSIDKRLVNAQEARRILDRLFGYEVSPVLWRKVRPRLSAGRVQSVATRLVVARERLRIAFHSADYWSVGCSLDKEGTSNLISAELQEIDGKRIAIGRHFDPSTGQLSQASQNDGVIHLDQKIAEGLRDELKTQAFTIREVNKKPFKQRPYPPFITSTLQQEAGRKLSYTSQRTMRVAQRLYESGFITYMRTDSTTLSEQAVEAARAQVLELYGNDYLPEKPREYRKKVKGAQEAHEAIRPAGEAFRTPEDLQDELDQESLKLYRLIWQRTIACQMKDVEGERTQVRIGAPVTHTDGRKVEALFHASGKVITFPGFLRAYVHGSDDPEAELEDRERVLPPVAVGDGLGPKEVEARGHSTQPPARYTEASLVKELEDRGIGRPSTYASIIQTIQDRGYVWKQGSALTPTLTAFAVTNLLELHFQALVDYEFTARMEGDLDDIGNGEREATPWLEKFYFGSAGREAAAEAGGAQASLEEHGLRGLIGSGVEEIDARAVSSIKIGETEDGEDICARVGRYGPYLQIGDTDRRANLADDIVIDSLDVAEADRLLQEAAMANRPIGTEPETGKTVYIKTGSYGPYVQLGEPELTPKGNIKKNGKPKMASLWPSMSVAEITIEQALLLLSYPKVLGNHPETGAEIVAQDGRFGPYLTMDTGEEKKETRSLENHDQLRDIDLAGAVALFKEPKKRGRRARAQEPIAELGESPVTKKQIQVRTGRFGPYVTDGQVNATIPSHRDPAKVTFDEALELIAAREQRMRDQGKDPRPEKKTKKKATKKKATKKAAKKTTKKKAAKKKTTKKKAAKKKTTKKKAKKKSAKKKAKSSKKSGASASA